MGSHNSIVHLNAPAHFRRSLAVLAVSLCHFSCLPPDAVPSLLPPPAPWASALSAGARSVSSQLTVVLVALSTVMAVLSGSSFLRVM